MSIFTSQITVDEASLLGRLRQITWGMVSICAVAVIGFLCLYSAAGGNIDPWALAQIIRFLFALVLLIGVAVIDLRWIFRAAYPFFMP